MLMTSLKPNYLPKASPTNTITLKIRASAHTFWRGTNIQPAKKKKLKNKWDFPRRSENAGWKVKPEGLLLKDKEP